MASTPNQREQTHPQEEKDQKILDAIGQQQLTDFHMAELARLLIRYKNFPGALGIHSAMESLLVKWGLTEATLYEKTRHLHQRVKIYQKQRLEEDQQDWF